VNLDNIQLSTTAVVPEPPTLILGSIGGLMGLGYAWRRRKVKLTARWAGWARIPVAPASSVPIGDAAASHPSAV
jgi:hypothetical protein